MGKINLTITTSDDEIFPLQVDDTAEMLHLQGLVEMISGIPPDKQALLLEQRVLPSTGTVFASGIRNGDLLQVSSQINPFALRPDGSAENAQAFLNACRQSPALIQRLGGGHPSLREAILNGDIEKLQTILRSQLAGRSAQNRNRMPVPEGDPLDPEYQRKMYEAIQQQNVEENFQQAIEYSPEVFGVVDMLYVDMAVNGEPVKAFIDSGAQTTIMTHACAEKCRIMRLVDKRFAGVAVGVGSAKILGRIHSCCLQVLDQFITTSITVLDQREGPQFIFGLDNLKRHECLIDLASKQLVIGSCNIKLPFLPSHEVPQDFNTKRVTDDKEDATNLSQNDALPSRVDVDPRASGTSASTNLVPQSNAPSEEALIQAQNLTGATRQQCIEALSAANGNLDSAVALLLGL